MSLQQFLPLLSVLDQDEHISTIPPLDRDHKFYWIFRNIDFKQWSSAKSSQVLLLSGPPERRIYQVSSYIAGQEKNTALSVDHFVLYFFCSAAGRATVANVVHTLLKQIVCCSSIDKRTPIIRTFLSSLVQRASAAEANYEWNDQGFNNEGSQLERIRKLLNAPANHLFTALSAVLDGEKQRCLFIIIDGLDKFEHQRDDFIREIRIFIDHLQRRTSKVKVLLTSRPLAEIKDRFSGLPCIEPDKERKGRSMPMPIM